MQRGYDEIGMISLVLWGCNNAKSSSVLVPRVWPFLADELNSEIGLKKKKKSKYSIFNAFRFDVYLLKLLFLYSGLCPNLWERWHGGGFQRGDSCFEDNGLVL